MATRSAWNSLQEQLRECLDTAFPDSKKVELESDKVNYMLSSVFFLANRLSKAAEGLAEFDRVTNSIEKVGKTSLEEKENQRTAHQIPKRARRHTGQVLLAAATASSDDSLFKLLIHLRVCKQPPIMMLVVDIAYLAQHLARRFVCAIQA